MKIIISCSPSLLSVVPLPVSLSRVRPSHRPVVEAAVDDGVVHGGAHGQPQHSQVHLLDEGLVKHLGDELVEQEEDVVGQPADREGAHHHDHHLHHLRCD